MREMYVSPWNTTAQSRQVGGGGITPPYTASAINAQFTSVLTKADSIIHRLSTNIVAQSQHFARFSSVFFWKDVPHRKGFVFLSFFLASCFLGFWFFHLRQPPIWTFTFKSIAHQKEREKVIIPKFPWIFGTGVIPYSCDTKFIFHPKECAFLLW